MSDMKIVQAIHSAAPYAVCIATGVMLWMKIKSVETKQDIIIEQMEDLKESLTGEALADAILAATSELKKDKKKKDKKDKKKKDKKKKDL